jgi:hypothetical protein
MPKRAPSCACDQPFAVRKRRTLAPIARFIFGLSPIRFGGLKASLGIVGVSFGRGRDAALLREQQLLREQKRTGFFAAGKA